MFKDGLGRKFFVTMYILTIASLFAITGILTGAEWITAVSVATAFFKFSNVWEKKQ
jgi:hypothetical protein